MPQESLKEHPVSTIIHLYRAIINRVLFFYFESSVGHRVGILRGTGKSYHYTKLQTCFA